MSTRTSRLSLLGLAAGCLLGGAGCLHTGMASKPDASPTSIPIEELDAANKLELPPKEKAKTCIATAQELDKKGMSNEAIALYERARALDSNYNRVCRRLAVLYDRFGNFVKADEEYAKALALFPKDPGLLNDCGYSHYCRGNWTVAEDYLRQAVDHKPDFWAAWVNLGMTLAQRDRVDEAKEAFRRAVPEPEVCCNLAFVYMSQQKFAEAAAEYRRALQLNPELSLAREALARLENPRGSTAATVDGIRPVSASGAESFANSRDGK